MNQPFSPYVPVYSNLLQKIQGLIFWMTHWYFCHFQPIFRAKVQNERKIFLTLNSRKKSE